MAARFQRLILMTTLGLPVGGMPDGDYQRAEKAKITAVSASGQFVLVETGGSWIVHGGLHREFQL